ncbi:MAG: hypothetical protein ACYS0K_22540 [Planctomycetota bacterium]|jgi:hypothetical protein
MRGLDATRRSRCAPLAGIEPIRMVDWLSTASGRGPKNSATIGVFAAVSVV